MPELGCNWMAISAVSSLADFALFGIGVGQVVVTPGARASYPDDGPIDDDRHTQRKQRCDCQRSKIPLFVKRPCPRYTCAGKQRKKRHQREAIAAKDVENGHACGQ